MDGKNYSAVPPPPSLTNASKGASPLDFNDALSKARAIAEKLKQQSSGAAEPTASSATAYSSSGTKRVYNDDDRDDYRSSSNTQSYGIGSYQDDRDSKRSAYDSGSSRPSYGNNESRRYGLGSEERKPSYGHYGGGGSATHQEDYSVPSHMVGLLIGKGGENLKKIERMSGVSKVQFSNDTSGPEREVHLTGEPDQISIARDMIRQMVEDAKNNESGRYGGSVGGRSNDYPGGGGGGGAPHQRGGHTATVTIPVHKVGLVIGRGGETIRDFEERSKARIMIQSEGPGDNSSERTINIVGEESNVQQAKNLIEDIVFGNNNAPPSRNWGNQQHQPYGNGGDNYSQHQQSHGYPPNSSYGMNRMGRPDDERIFVKVPSSAVGLIIGRGGENVKALQDQSGARVKVDPSTDPNAEERTVNISGDPKCVALAKQLVEEKVQEAANRHGGGYNNDRYNKGGYRSQNQDYNQQSGYGAEGGGYDYSQQQQQYNQYYAQYGYGQNQYGQTGQDSSNAYQQYPGYQYNASYRADQSEGDSSAPPPPPGSSEENGKASDESNKDENNRSDSKDNTLSQMDPSAYYAQYYGNQQQMTPEQQQAYYQWYQQYYGAQQQQYGNHDQSQQNNDPSQQERDQEQHNNEPSDSNQKPADDVDGEPIEDNAEGDKADSSESSKKAQTD